MPRIVPEPKYGQDTPDVADFYARLAEGMRLTLNGEAAKHDELKEAASAMEPQVTAAEAALAPLLAELEDAERKLAELRARPRPHTGLRAFIAAVKSANCRVNEAQAGLTSHLNQRDEALRGIELRQGSQRLRHALQNGDKHAGSAPFGVYAFYDYDGHAMYVGKTTEGVSVRVRRHLTNQRTDAVAMSVLDPLEVVEVEVWPLWPTSDEEKLQATDLTARLEYAVERASIAQDHKLFNEKKIPEAPAVELPASVRFDVLSYESRARLGHPDLRIARRSAVSARLASRIVERSLKNVGLRRSLGRQLARLTQLAEERFADLGGEAAVDVDTGEEE